MYSDKCLPQVGGRVSFHKKDFLEKSKLRLCLEGLHSFTQQMFIEHLYARLSSGHYGYGHEQNRLKKLCPVGLK